MGGLLWCNVQLRLFWCEGHSFICWTNGWYA